MSWTNTCYRPGPCCCVRCPIGRSKKQGISTQEKDELGCRIHLTDVHFISTSGVSKAVPWKCYMNGQD